MSPPPLTDAQLHAELLRCESCETRPCRSGCPASLSPGDFILAARGGERSDWRRAAAHILGQNPLGGVCGSVCPDSLCMARCTRRHLDAPVNIPAVQAAIVRKARDLGVLPRFDPLASTGQRVAVVGAGPAGLGAASVLAKAGHSVHVLDRSRRPGGMARLIPRHRLDPEVLEADVAWLLGLGDARLVLGKPVPLPRDLLARGFAAVVVAGGLGEPVELDVPGRERAIPWTRVLGPRPPSLRGRRVAVVGDGSVAVDCTGAALAQGAEHVELFARKSLSELELTRAERERLFASGVHLSCRVRVTAIRGRGRRVTGLALRKLELPPGQAFHPGRLADLPHGAHERRDVDAVILALGGRAGLLLEPHPRIFYAGDLESGPTSVVEALASGKRAGLAVHARLSGDDLAACPDRATCADGSGCPRRATCPEWNAPAPGALTSGAVRGPARLPVPLATGLLGLEIASPFLLAVEPPADGYAQLRRAYEAGWAGGVLGTDLDRACADVERLRREFPDRLTMASGGGPITADAETDARAWQATTRRLEAAGAMAVAYALPVACGGAASGSSVASDPERCARVVEWVLAASDPGVPKVFELPAGAATEPVLARLAEAFARHPGKRAGVAISGASLVGARLADAERLALARAARHRLLASARADALDYRSAAGLLALGAPTVQLSAIAWRCGVGIVNELSAGLSYLLAERGLRSVAELAGSDLGGPPSGAPPPSRDAVQVSPALCARCGNCSRCACLAVALDATGKPVVDEGRCVGCGACVERCFVGALSLRPAATTRTASSTARLFAVTALAPRDDPAAGTPRRAP